MYKQNYRQSPTIPHHHNHNPRNDYYEDSNSEIYIDQTYQKDNLPLPPPPPPPRVSRNQGANNPSQHQQQQHQQQPPQIIRPTTPIYHQHQRPHTTTPSEYSSVSKSKAGKNKGGVVIETMSAPNPCCPDSKGVCCILLLVNLGLILVTLGFSVVLQLFEPAFVWYCGLLFLIVGFIALIVSLLFCMRICSFSRWSTSSNSSIHGGNAREPSSELYWTHHWQKRINLPGTTSRASTNNMRDNNSDIVFHSGGSGNQHNSRGVYN